MNWWLIPVVAYAIGYVVTAVLMTRYWYRDFGSRGDDFLGGAAWGMLGAIIWPLVVPLTLVAIVGRRLA